jgi:hypothetical protein
MTDKTPDPVLLANLRDRLSAQAMQLNAMLGPFWTASSLIGAGLVVARTTMGDARAAAWLREMADEIEGAAGPGDDTGGESAGRVH